MKLQLVKAYYPNGNILREYTENEEGQKYGTFQHWYPNGQLWTRSEYVDGNRHGTFQGWWENGQLWEQREYVNGNRHGTFQVWYDNGQLWMQSEYVNGERHGLRYSWNRDGSLCFIQQWDNDKLLVEVDYSTIIREQCEVIITIYGVNVESTGFVAGVVVMLKEEGRKFKIIHVKP